MKINQFDPYLTRDEISSVMEVLRDNWITEGKKTEEFKKMLQDYCGVKYAILLPNGTLALYVGLMILGIGPGDEVIVPDFTFAGSATAVVLTGAKPVFADVNLHDFNLDIGSLQKCISARTKAIMPVHIYGQSAEMDKVLRIARTHRLKVIEDAAQGIGVSFGNRHVGSLGDVGILSFYADKTITTAEGGALLTNSRFLAEECIYLRNQGRLSRGSFIHPKMGYNFRFTDLQAALGVAQMRKLSFIIEKKLHIEGYYKQFLKEAEEVRSPEVTTHGKRVPFRINILVKDPKGLGGFLQKKGIGVRRFFYPLHRQPCFNKENCIRLTSYPHSDEIFASGLSLPSGVRLTKKQIRQICDQIK
ncbi:MAG: DegT/DnrJ/EryC1/StrS family aminotransferase, partial [Candidatus Omnitrophica bacterium]|nr:DegT/DnrJ/EryC1/StrS family aminotransferase [Candidatus Omnitrophota bacterium]